MKKYLLLCVFLVGCHGNANTQEIVSFEQNISPQIELKELYKGDDTIIQTGGVYATGVQDISMGGTFQPVKEIPIQETIVPLNSLSISGVSVLEENVGVISFSGNISYNFTQDYSLQKYVSPKYSFLKLNYEPSDLMDLTGSYLVDVKGHQTLRKEANEQLQMLSEKFYQHFGVSLRIISAYRSYQYQVGIKANGCSDTFCAKAGYSEHQTGLAIDIFEASTAEEFLAKSNLREYFTWLGEHAHEYGFHNSYQKGKKIDGYAREPWHWRYLGQDFATYLWQHNMTFGEYYNSFNL